MSATSDNLDHLLSQAYPHGFVTEIEADSVPKGLSEDVIRAISAKKHEPEFMLAWRLGAYRHWLTMSEPHWGTVRHAPIDYQDIVYYSAPRARGDGPLSLDDIDPELLRTYEKLGVPLHERALLAGVAVDAVFDSVSVATTFQRQLAQLGIIFCPFSEAVRRHPDLVRRYLGSVVPYADNFFACLNAAVFSDGSFCYLPPGVQCPMKLSTYFRINAKNTGQFERTLIIADRGARVSYLEGCTAPMRDEHQLHAAVVELVALEGARIQYTIVQNWYPGDRDGKGGIYNFVTKRGDCREANVHRGIHALSQCATDAFEAARETVRRFINAPRAEDIIFVRGCTEAINLVAQSYGRANLAAGDEIVLTEMEHHSNIVPWQILCGQTGIGVLYGKSALLRAMPPWQGGGDMIEHVSFARTTYNAPPYKFEAGTPDIGGALGLGAALDYVEGVGRAAIAAHERDLLDYATGLAGAVPGLRLIGQARDKAAILSFVIDGMHPHDIGTVLDYEGVAIRSGHSCAMPLMDHFGIAAIARASFALYNTRDEVDALLAGIAKARQLFGAPHEREAGHE